jgi:hypothetical protein
MGNVGGAKWAAAKALPGLRAGAARLHTAPEQRVYICRYGDGGWKGAACQPCGAGELKYRRECSSADGAASRQQDTQHSIMPSPARRGWTGRYSNGTWYCVCNLRAACPRVKKDNENHGRFCMRIFPSVCPSFLSYMCTTAH